MNKTKIKTQTEARKREALLTEQKAERIGRLLSQLSFIEEAKIPEIALELAQGHKAHIASNIEAIPPRNGNPLRFELINGERKKNERFKTLYEAFNASQL